MRHLAIVFPFLLLSGCGASVESERPLFSAGAGKLKSGMWAAVSIDKPCEITTSTAIFSWPDCAAPILIRDGTATYFTPGHAKVTFEIADGAPNIVQSDKDIVGGWARSSDQIAVPNPGRRFYASFYPASDTPFTAGRLLFLSCSPTPVEAIDEPRSRRKKSASEQEKPIEGLREVRIGDDKHCIADKPDAVRELARRADSTDA